MDNSEKIRMMREESIPVVLAKMGIPTMIGMMMSALYSIVDAYFVGFLGTSQVAAISVVFPIVQLIVGLGMMFGSGAASYIARLLGNGDRNWASRVASTSVVTSIMVGAVSIGFTLVFLDGFLAILGATETVLPYAREYAIVFVGGSIFNIFNITMNNVITAEGRARLTMIAMLTSGGLNIVLDWLFVLVFGWDVQGAAWATVLAQLACTCIYLCFLLGKRGYLEYSPHLFTLNKNIYAEVLKVGIPILVFQLLTSIALSLTNTVAAIYGDSALAAAGVVTRIMTLGTYVVFGYMKGYQPVAGFCYGARAYDRMNRATKLSLIASTAFCVAVAVLFIVLPEQIISLFTTGDTEFTDIGARMLRANGYILPFFGFQMVYLSLFLALGMGRQGGLLSICRQGLYFIPAILALPTFFGIGGVIWAQPLADALTVVTTSILAVRLNRKIREERCLLTTDNPITMEV